MTVMQHHLKYHLERRKGAGNSHLSEAELSRQQVRPFDPHPVHFSHFHSLGESESETSSNSDMNASLM